MKKSTFHQNEEKSLKVTFLAKVSKKHWEYSGKRKANALLAENH